MVVVVVVVVSVVASRHAATLSTLTVMYSCIPLQYAHAMRSKLKTVEGRPGIGWAANVKANDWITFKISASGGMKLICRATRVRHFPTFQAMLRECGVEACLPGLEGGLSEGVRIYRSFGSFSGKLYADLEALGGAIAIDVEPLSPAP